MNDTHDIKPGQSTELLKELHILTRDGRMNQDSRRKLKQVNHLYQFIEPLLQSIQLKHPDIQLVDHGAGKSYLGFILYDLFFKAQDTASHIYGIETREELVSHACSAVTISTLPGRLFECMDSATDSWKNDMPEKFSRAASCCECWTSSSRVSMP